MRWALAVLLAAGCGRCGFSATTDAVATDVAPASRSTLSIDRIDPGGTLLDFPLLVTLDDTRAARDLLDATASNLRFVDASGTVLAHEIDQVGTAGPTGAPLLAWVRVPMIVGTTTTIAVEIGGALPAPSSLPVWVSTYEAVYHMTDSTDATPHHDDLTPFNANMIVATSG